MVRDRLTGNFSTEDVLLSNVPLIGSISTLDAITAFGPAFVVLFFGQQILPNSAQNYVLGTCGFLTALGFIGLIAAPDHTSLGTYASRFWHHKRRPAKIRYKRKNDREDVLERSLIEYDERTQDLTEVERLYPQYDAIELTDGSMVAAVEVTPGNLDTSKQDEQMRVVNNVTSFFNNTLDFPITFYTTTRLFEAEEFLEEYQNRKRRISKALEDPLEHIDPDDEMDTDELNEEMDSMDALRSYIDHHMEWVTTRLGGRPVREHYVIVSVSRREVRDSVGGEDTLSESLSEVPIVGKLVSASSADEGYQMSDEEIKLEQFSALDKRAAEIENSFTSALGEQADGERVRTPHFAALIKEYWESEQVKRDDFQRLVGNMPIVVGRHDKGDNNE